MAQSRQAVQKSSMISFIERSKRGLLYDFNVFSKEERDDLNPRSDMLSLALYRMHTAFWEDRLPEKDYWDWGDYFIKDRASFIQIRDDEWAIWIPGKGRKAGRIEDEFIFYQNLIRYDY